VIAVGGGDGGAAAGCAARADLYGFLSGAFARELDRDTWLRLCGEGARTELRDLAVACEVEVDAAGLLAFLAEHRDRDPAAVVEDLAADYARLFIGPGPGLAPPYESLYGAERRFYGEAFAQVTAFLRAQGVEVGPEFGAPADHIAVELSIMQHLARLSAAQPVSLIGRDPLRRQLEFLDRHLLRWAPRWATDVRREGATGFYREAAGLLEGHLRRDAGWLRCAIGAASADGDAPP